MRAASPFLDVARSAVSTARKPPSLSHWRLWRRGWGLLFQKIEEWSKRIGLGQERRSAVDQRLSHPLGVGIRAFYDDPCPWRQRVPSPHDREYITFEVGQVKVQNYGSGLDRF